MRQNDVSQKQNLLVEQDGEKKRGIETRKNKEPMKLVVAFVATSIIIATYLARCSRKENCAHCPEKLFHNGYVFYPFLTPGKGGYIK